MAHQLTIAEVAREAVGQVDLEDVLVDRERTNIYGPEAVRRFARSCILGHSFREYSGEVLEDALQKVEELPASYIRKHYDNHAACGYGLAAVQVVLAQGRKDRQDSGAQLELEDRAQVDLEECVQARQRGETLEQRELELDTQEDDGPASPLECSHCGLELEAYGLDATRTAHGVYVDWLPCCNWKREAVGLYGWEDVHGVELAEALWLELGLDVSRVYPSDYLASFSLALKSPGPGVSGWQTSVFEDVDQYHLHHDSPAGWKFGLACYNGPIRVGVAVVGRPVSRMIQTNEPGTLEVTRVCTFGDGRLRRNAASKLLGGCRREALRRGYTKLITYTLETEDAASVKAANFVPTHRTNGGSWDRPSRSREDNAPTCPKVRWELGLDKETRREVEGRRIELEE